MNNDTTSPTGTPSAFPRATGSASGPRLRCSEKWANGFYGTYRGHQVAIERDSRNDPWTFLVVCPDGTYAADGVMRERTTMREAIIYALRGALLWPNIAAQPTARTEPRIHG
jgi:hypothetical protein